MLGWFDGLTEVGLGETSRDDWKKVKVGGSRNAAGVSYATPLCHVGVGLHGAGVGMSQHLLDVSNTGLSLA